MRLAKLNADNSQGKKSRKSPLSKKWQAIQRQLNQNANVERKMADFYTVYEKHFKEKEQHFLRKRAQMVEYLCGFLQRKSLSKTTFHELGDFIESEIENIAGNPFVEQSIASNLQKSRDQNLQDRQDKYSNDQKTLDSLRAHLEGHPWVPEDLSDEQLGEFIRNPIEADKKIQKWVEEWEAMHADQENTSSKHNEQYQQAYDELFEDDYFCPEDFDEYDEEHEYFENHNEDSEQSEEEVWLEQFMKSSEIKKLFKKLANTLHPDKVSDDVKKSEYASAMKELIEARKSGDFFDLLSIAQTYVPDYDLAISKQQEKRLSEALDRKLKNLQHQYIATQQAPTLHARIWAEFHDKNKHQQKRNFDMHESWMESMIQDADNIIEHVTSVPKLKVFLRGHFEQLYMESFDDLNRIFIDEFDADEHRNPFD